MMIFYWQCSYGIVQSVRGSELKKGLSENWDLVIIQEEIRV